MVPRLKHAPLLFWGCADCAVHRGIAGRSGAKNFALKSSVFLALATVVGPLDHVYIYQNAFVHISTDGKNSSIAGQCGALRFMR